MVWSLIKQYTKPRNTTFEIEDVDMLMREAIKLVTAEQWDNYCQHVLKVEEEIWRLDMMQDDIIDAFVIHNPNDPDDDSGISSDSDGTIIMDYAIN